MKEIRKNWWLYVMATLASAAICVLSAEADNDMSAPEFWIILGAALVVLLTCSIVGHALVRRILHNEREDV